MTVPAAAPQAPTRGPGGPLEGVPDTDPSGSTVRDMLARLGVGRLVLGIHDASFPSLDEEETGRGTPYSSGGLRFLEFARGLGFDAIQLGPSGQTSAANPSPYDGTLFSRSSLSIALLPLVEDGLLAIEELRRLLSVGPPSRHRVPHGHARQIQHEALQAAWSAFRTRPPEPLASGLRTFEEEHARWLDRDAVFAALASLHGTDDWSLWPGLDSRLHAPGPAEEERCRRRERDVREQHADEVARYRFEQYLVHRQHHALRARIGSLGLRLLGDLQVGTSGRDLWGFRRVFLDGYLLGAPPSRTNREGQPWGYPVLDPRGCRPGGPGRDLLATRVDKMLSEHDGLRIDHPHGLVCPWVYRSDDPDAYHAVQNGARLYASPDLADHPALASLAIVRKQQIDPSLPRHADFWVKELTEEQVAQYALPLDVIVERALARGRSPGDIACEVLSTWPHPLRRAMARHGLGRFCVTQKVDPRDPHDLYRSETCRPEDWIMVGNHDTRPVWTLVRGWNGTAEATRRAAYLAERLVPRGEGRGTFAERLERDPLAMAEAMFADLFVGPASNVFIFFADLLGMQETYNVPGTQQESNWTLRVPHDFEAVYRERVARREAVDIARAARMAIAAREGRDAGGAASS